MLISRKDRLLVYVEISMLFLLLLVVVGLSCLLIYKFTGIIWLLYVLPSIITFICGGCFFEFNDIIINFITRLIARNPDER